jgi:hypothetical protein
MAYKKLTEEEKLARREARKEAKHVKKEQDRVEAEKNQKKVKRMIITIEWKKSRTWGWCPRATANVEYHDGRYATGEYYASGCGYCKESTVIASAFNDFLKYKLHEVKKAKKEKAPYGISFYVYEDLPSYNFEGGVGTSCYYPISEFIGGKFKHISNTKRTDVFEYIDN